MDDDRDASDMALAPHEDAGGYDGCPECGALWDDCWCVDDDPANADPVIAFGPDLEDDDDLDYCPTCGSRWEFCECDDDPLLPARDFVGVELAPGAVFHVAAGIRPETLAALRRMAELVRGGALS